MIDVAVITGGKAHGVLGFHELFHSIARINSYIQHIDGFASSYEAVRECYDVVLFCFMMLEGPADEGLPGYCGQPKTSCSLRIISILYNSAIASGKANLAPFNRLLPGSIG